MPPLGAVLVRAAELLCLLCAAVAFSALAAPTAAVRVLWRSRAYRALLARSFASPGYGALERALAPRKRALLARALVAASLPSPPAPPPPPPSTAQPSAGTRRKSHAAPPPPPPPPPPPSPPPPVVLELGAGRGVNLRLLPPSVKSLLAVEPNDAVLPSLRDTADEAGVALCVLCPRAEALPLPNASVDVALCSWLLCTAEAPEAVLREVRRVLKPGGQFVFAEHVAAPPCSARRAAQRLLRAPWQLCAGGCRPDQDTEALIRAAEFAAVSVERFTLQPPLIGGAWSTYLVGTKIASIAVR